MASNEELSNQTQSPLEAAAGAAGARATDVFAILANETRLAILLALWEAYEPSAAENAVSFTALRDRVGLRQGTQFTYHLDQLVGHFVRKTDDGYELQGAGQKLVRTVIGGAGIEDATLSSTTLEMSCHRCGEGQVELSYQNETLYLTCQECEGFLARENTPQEGVLATWELDPAGLASRAPTEVLVASAIATKHRSQAMSEGICPDCSGATESTLQVCDEHTPDPGELCSNCGTPDRARIRYRCTVCKNAISYPVNEVVQNHPAVIAFYYEHGVDLRYDVEDITSFIRVWELFWEQEYSLTSTDPVRIRVTIPCEDDELHLMLDEELSVIDVSESD